MEEFYSKQGVFIYSDNLESKCMVQCLQSVLETWPDMQISSVISDMTHKGYRLHFEHSDVKSVLDKRCIKVDDRQIHLYPLTSFLIIQDVQLSRGISVESDIEDAICDQFGKVLKFKKLPGTTDLSPEKATVSFLAHVDIPEVSELSAFQNNGYPEMVISIPNLRKILKVQFWCRRCRLHGHIHQECSKNPKQTGRRQEGKASTTPKSNQKTIEMSPRGQTSIQQFYKGLNLLKNTDRFASEIGREIAKEVVHADGKLTQVNKTDECKNSVSQIKDTFTLARSLRNQDALNTEIWKENDSVCKNAETSEKKEHSSCSPRNLTSSGDDLISPSHIKQEVNDNSFYQFGITSNREFKSDDDTWPFPPDATSTTDDDVQIIENQESTSSISHQSTDSRDATPESDGFKKEFVFPSGSQAHSSYSYPNVPSTNRNRQQPGPSTPKQQIETTRVLSERLQNCINDSCKVLDRRTLDAFLTHVKKKSNPIRVAANYTANVQGLKDQLKEILYMYYNTPQTGTKEDIAFIKWLNGLVDRFDGTVPRKRKPSARAEDGTPNKK